MIVTQLNSRIFELVSYLLPNGKKQGKEWVVGSLQGEPGESLKVCLYGPKVGVFSDFATGDSGDCLELWKKVRGLDTKTAMEEASSWLGCNFKPMFYPKKTQLYFKEISKDWIDTQPHDPVFMYLTKERGLSERTISKFGIGTKDNRITFPFQYSGQIVKAKYLSLIRNNGKKDIYATPNTPPCLFGWQSLSDDIDEITLTEGELDAMSLYQMGYPSLSVPLGGGIGGKHDWIDNEYENLKRFKRINICFDQDYTGRASIKEVVIRLGAHRCFVIQLPCKDANEYLTSCLSDPNAKPIQYYFENAIDCAPSEFCSVSRFAKLVEEYFYPNENSFLGYSPPWEGLKSKFMFRHNELTIWTGINGHGKSQLLGQIALELMHQGAKVCIVSLEMPPKLLLARLIRQATGQPKPDKSLIEKVFFWLRTQLWIYENRSSITKEKLIQIMEYGRCCHGIDVFIIDSLMKCGLGEEDYNAQKDFTEALCNFKNLHDCQIHLVAHPRKGANEKQSPGKMDVKGSGALSDLADNVFAVWRNKAKSNNAPYDCKLSCDKHRNGDWEGEFLLWFDKASFLFSEKVNHPIKPYIASIPPGCSMEA